MAKRFVDDDAGPGIINMERNVVIHENNDVFIFQPTFLQYLVCMAYISLIKLKFKS